MQLDSVGANYHASYKVVTRYVVKDPDTIQMVSPQTGTVIELFREAINEARIEVGVYPFITSSLCWRPTPGRRVMQLV
jgi:hypothetical protein